MSTDVTVIVEEGNMVKEEPRAIKKKIVVKSKCLPEVGVAAEIRLLSVDDVEETFLVALLIHTHFQLSPGALEESAEDGVEVDDAYQRIAPEHYRGFLPAMAVVNCVDSRLPEFEKVIRVHRAKGIVWVSYYNVCNISENLELYKFPFDRQLFRVSFRSANSKLRPWSTDLYMIDFVDITRGKPTAEEMNATYLVACEKKRWFMDDFVVSYFPDDSDPANLTTGEFLISIRVDRNPMFYLFSFFLVIYLIVLANVSVLSLPAAETGDRNIITITLLLTLVSFKFILLQSTPKVGYMTYLDIYVAIAFGFLAIGVIENVFISPKVICLLTGEEFCEVPDEFLLSSASGDVTFQIIFAMLWSLINLFITICCLSPSLVRYKWEYVEQNQIGATHSTVMKTCEVKRHSGDEIRVEKAGPQVVAKGNISV